RFNDWAGAYHVVGPLVTLDESALVGDALDVRAAGSFDFGGHLDLGATMMLPVTAAARAGTEVRAVAAAASDTAGRVPVGLTIRGLAEKPDVALDLSEARQNVVARARAAAEEQAKQAAGKAVQEAAKRVLPDSIRGMPTDSLTNALRDTLQKVVKDSAGAQLADSLKARADSAKKALQDSLKKKLRRFIPPLSQRP
ncbi:MAG TPA: hypothetical protein VJ957_01950, partial [Longimicrobiales bacterium]|nr:hypothetical protein [Longimicrobiales bacterium]